MFYNHTNNNQLSVEENAMSTYDTLHHIHRSIKAGASGYVIKDDASRLVPAVRTLNQGKRYFSQKSAELAKVYLEEQAK
jgi:DNA-binding NarL/FixJ family response regulator